LDYQNRSQLLNLEDKDIQPSTATASVKVSLKTSKDNNQVVPKIFSVVALNMMDASAWFISWWL